MLKAADPEVRSGLVSFLYLTVFEFETAKSAANNAKHGIDFVERTRSGKTPTVSSVGAIDRGARFLVVGQIAQTTWTATVTYRHEDTIRIISVRHARTEEKARYLEGRAEARDR